MWLQQLPNPLQLGNAKSWIDGKGTSDVADNGVITFSNTTASVSGVGKAGGSYILCNGTNTTVSRSLPSVFDAIATTDFSVTMWLNAGLLSSEATFDRIFEAWYDANNAVQFVVDDDDSIAFGVEDAGDQRSIAGSGLSTGTDYFLTGTWDASANSVKFYVNGTLQSGTISGAWSVGDTQEMRIGSRTDHDADTFFSGLVTQCIVFDKVLTVSQIQQMYNKHK